MKRKSGQYAEYMIDDGILHVVYTVREVDETVARGIVQGRLEFCEGKKYPLLADARSVVGATKAGRAFLASAEGVAGITAAAVFTDSAFTKFMANFFMRITSVPMPTKLFTDKELALKWLNKYKS